MLPFCERLSLVVFLTIVSSEYLRESREGEEERDTRDSCLLRLRGLRVPDLNLHTGASMLLGNAILVVVHPPAEPIRGGARRILKRFIGTQSTSGESFIIMVMIVTMSKSISKDGTDLEIAKEEILVAS
ncbi:hypothetical protein M9H77_14021 [Catharanthus roseus]|uniref:Uncharacterized protein n=1 Tax=Catharanthus roseus TaxID=4058 RepID=A0ACC0BLU0_CATRO|nr:hypothetical protein M9H77_14021 [Catharanthus roseus]